MSKKTPLYENHVAHGGKIVEFAGYMLPVQYEAGIKAEHNCVRENVGIFDVSHMGEFLICGKDATACVNHLVTNDISTMVDGQVKYTLMLNERGGVVDDLLVYRLSEEEYMLVVNASNCEKDAKWAQMHLIGDVTFTNPSDKIGQVALQGRNAEKVLSKLTDAIPQKYYTFVTTKLLGCDALISRTGYTGEDGFEIYTEDVNIGKVFEAIIEAGKEYGLLCCGLGARDTLRFEACLPLYGHELSEDYRAHELALNIFIKMDKPEFVGKQALLDNPPAWRRKGVKLIDRGIAREGSKVYDENNNEIGFVTTGTMSPTLNEAIAMVRIIRDFDGPFVYIDVRGKLLKAEIIKMPFYKRAQA
ncbi:MAG: glycine cleavage system aminomethyltransferase GcvT [Clostridia bacterium]|nr:glycine cleavage system aminomethyltransferase GcvT [Clostridia bacterium]